LRNDALILRDNLFFDEVDYYNEPIFVHSKLRMIDDRYLSVGSCNMNNRGYKYEGEMNVSVLDDAFVSAARAEIFADMVGEYASYLSDDAQNNFEVLRMVSQENRITAEWWADQGEDLSIDDALDEWVVYRPSGFVYPLDFSEDYLDVAGPDLF
jgi:phosphatidylserine/phosphatidylglycerophosphate/cardiolipin synthase-like enzyme